MNSIIVCPIIIGNADIILEVRDDPDADRAWEWWPDFLYRSIKKEENLRCPKCRARWTKRVGRTMIYEVLNPCCGFEEVPLAPGTIKAKPKDKSRKKG